MSIDDNFFGDSESLMPCPCCKRRFNVKTNDTVRLGTVVQCPACEASIEIGIDGKPFRFTPKN